MPYTFTTLDRRTDIRLLTLNRGSGDDPIVCGLNNTSEEDRPPYEALSYTWGSPDDVADIQLNGTVISIRENLWQALWHLRREGEDRIIWADAICIDQNNILERNHQVKLMKSIYTQASDVAVWLGLEGDESDTAMDFLRDDSDERFVVEMQEDTVGHPPLPNELVMPLRKLLHRDYWTRMWILQEFSLASQLTMYCGTKFASWTDLEYVRQFWEWEPALGDTYASDIFWYRSKMHGGFGYTPLITLLRKYHDRRCVDSRDSIFALISMASDCQNDEIVAEYSQSLFSAYCSVLQCYVSDRIGGSKETKRYEREIFRDLLQFYLQSFTNYDFVPVNNSKIRKPRVLYGMDEWVEKGHTDIIELCKKYFPYFPDDFSISGYISDSAADSRNCFYCQSRSNFHQHHLILPQQISNFSLGKNLGKHFIDPTRSSSNCAEHEKIAQTEPFPGHVWDLYLVYLFIEAFLKGGDRDLDLIVVPERVSILPEGIATEISIDTTSGDVTIIPTGEILGNIVIVDR